MVGAHRGEFGENFEFSVPGLSLARVEALHKATKVADIRRARIFVFKTVVATSTRRGSRRLLPNQNLQCHRLIFQPDRNDHRQWNKTPESYGKSKI